MAAVFPKAFPPMVNAAIIAVISKLVINRFRWKEFAKMVDKATPAEPLIIPHISPITSLQKLDAFSLFLISFTAILAPRTCLVAIELKVFKSATVTLIPIISNKIPIPINNKIIIIATILVALGIMVSEKSEKIKEMKKAKIVTVSIHL